MENEEEFGLPLLSGKQGDFYTDLLDSYEGFIFHNEDDENEFINHLKSVLDNDMDFETKIYIIRGLTMDVVLHKIVDREFYLKNYSKKL